MPAAYVTYGWRQYQGQKCSYKGYEAPCPGPVGQGTSRAQAFSYQDADMDESFFDNLFGRELCSMGTTWCCLL